MVTVQRASTLLQGQLAFRGDKDKQVLTLVSTTPYTGCCILSLFVMPAACRTASTF